MKTALRMVGIATTIIWLMLALFIVTAVYSATLLEINFEEPRFYVSEDNVPTIAFIIEINNRGYYTLEDFTLETEILYQNTTQISSKKTYVAAIPAGEQTLITHSLAFHIDHLLLNASELLFEDANFTVVNRVKLNFTSLLPIMVSANNSFPWGAPLYNFTVGEVAFEPYNSTHSKVSFPISFQNHAFFNLTGTLNVKVFDERNNPISESELPVNVFSRSDYFNKLEFYVENVESVNVERVELVFTSDLFTFGPWVVPLEK
ncbi:hypothetical protein DRO34_03780 [Candidatus Bathyarchaeota archaeon]|nr:MAG: hypothetical protein DRO34_03780 [Candidatus Bathyarchaeota archaeon]